MQFTQVNKNQGDVNNTFARRTNPMVLEIPYLEHAFSVDRDGHDNGQGRQGFEIHFDKLTIHFADEEDAEDVAKEILKRLGKA